VREGGDGEYPARAEGVLLLEALLFLRPADQPLLLRVDAHSERLDCREARVLFLAIQQLGNGCERGIFDLSERL